MNRITLYDHCISHPESNYLLIEWDYSSNDKMPQDYYSGSGKKVNWVCRKCGYLWPAAIGKRVGHIVNGVITEKPRGCPACASRVVWEGHNDLKTLAPELAEEWDYLKNGNMKPEDFLPNPNERVNWICKNNSKHKWPAIIANRFKGAGCPFCARKKRGKTIRKKSIKNGNTLALKYPEIAEEWDYSRNGNMKPEDFPPYSNEKVYWICKYCKHGWKDFIANRTKHGRKCTNCQKLYQTSIAEQIIFSVVKMIYPDSINGYKDSSIDQYSLDIYIPSINLGIEYDGEPWHKVVSKDINKTLYMLEKGIDIIRIREQGCPELKIGTRIIVSGKTDHSTYKYLYEVIEELLDYLSMYYNKKIDIKYDITEIRDKVIKDLNQLNKDNSLEKIKPDLCKEWNYEKNNGLKPSMFLPQSNVKVWWKCLKCSYEYQMQISNRFYGEGCGVCAGKVLWKGHNDFESQCPELMKEWCFEKNNGIFPDELKLGDSKTEVWWKCSVCGHEWNAYIYNRVHLHSGCPECAKKIIGMKTRKRLSKKVLCLTTGEIFNSMTEAGEKYGIGKSGISACCRGKMLTSGKLSDGRKLRWQLIDEDI